MPGETPARLFSAKDTALADTPASRAMSFIVGRFGGCSPTLSPTGLSSFPSYVAHVPYVRA
ncbi:hypothetical protein GCM10009801_62100 [Streptomyces albiaxialis]|uniref:Uncharacterized protein n=1 Tax=Streptomyces albiaxialis TaxID=329523 RepID=A0ABP5I9J2_9ACTN